MALAKAFLTAEEKNWQLEVYHRPILAVNLSYFFYW